MARASKASARRSRPALVESLNLLEEWRGEFSFMLDDDLILGREGEKESAFRETLTNLCRLAAIHRNHS